MFAVNGGREAPGPELQGASQSDEAAASRATRDAALDNRTSNSNVVIQVDSVRNPVGATETPTAALDGEQPSPEADGGGHGVAARDSLRWIAALAVALAAIAVFLFGAVGLDESMLALVAAILLAVPAGKAVEAVGLPPLLGMLIIGVILRNLPGDAGIAKFIDPEWSGSLRSVALGIILARAGLGLNVKAVLALGWACARLALIPNIVEAFVVSGIAKAMDPSLPYVWCLMIGFVLSAVSPAVVVPSLLRLKDQGWGTDQGIPSMVLAAASLDDVLSIAGFGLLLPMALPAGHFAAEGGGESHDALANATAAANATDIGTTQPSGHEDAVEAWHAALGPVELLGGALLGYTCGRLVAWSLSGGSGGVAAAKSAVVGLLCTGLLLMGRRLELTGGAAMAALAFGIGLAQQWRLAGEGRSTGVVSADLKRAWSVAQPALFVLIGTAVDFQHLHAGSIGLAGAALAVGLLCRWAAAMQVTAGAKDLTRRDRAFIGLAWLPKATVQAAIGGTALDAVVALGYTADTAEAAPFYNYGLLVLTAAVLSILVTAPVGAVAIDLSGPRLLRRAAGR